MAAPGVTFNGITLDVPTDKLALHVNGAVPAGVTAGSVSAVSSNVNLTAFEWTWAAKAGALVVLR